MRILHLTDFHFRSTEQTKFDQDQLIEKLSESLRHFKGVDLVFFSGDIVNTGNSIADFAKAKEMLLDKIVEVTGVYAQNIFICEGNHDVHRSQEMSAINMMLAGFKTVHELDSFVKNVSDREYLESLENHKNYYHFAREFYAIHSSDHGDDVNELYSVHKRDLDGKRIGIVTINSAWRSRDSNTDKTNLLFPVSILKDLIQRIDGCDLKIFMMHHPVCDFKEYVMTEIEDLIYHHFHILLSGHVHKRKQSMYITSDEGIFCCSASATLSLFDRDSRLGYSLLDVNDDKEVQITNVIYDQNERLFAVLEPIKVQIPLNKTKTEQNEFRKTVKKRIVEEIEEASSLFISGTEEERSGSFTDLFTNPILKTKSSIETTPESSGENVPVESLMISKGSHIVFGKDKSGKTAILKKINIDLLKTFAENRIFPYYIDCKTLRESDPVKLESLLARYYEVSKGKLAILLKNYHLKLLIDNYNPGLDSFNTELGAFLEKNTNVSFIAAMEETLSRSYESLKIGNHPHVNVFIHELSRREVRLLANKWPNLNDAKREHVIDKIGLIFIQLNIPMNYWTVSLFLWLFEKNSELNFHNSVELIQLYVDGILERNKIAFDKKFKITFDDFKHFIGHLAHEFIKVYHEHGYSCTYVELTSFIDKYKQNDKKFVVEVEDMIKILIEKGVLKKRFDQRYTFRLNGVFEYFLAYHMLENASFKAEIIDDNHFYLSFSNELELYSGFNRKDQGLFNAVFLKTKQIFESTNLLYTSVPPDTLLIEKVNEAFDFTAPFSQLTDKKELTLAPERQDELLDEFMPVEIQQAEVQRKKFYDTIEANPENLEKALKIFARVFRNSSLKDPRVLDEALEFILTSACNLGFALVDETAELDNKDDDDGSDKKEKLLMKLMASFMPLIVQTFLFDALAQNNLTRIIDEKIKELKKDSRHNQFKLLLLYFLIIDLDVRKSKKYIDEVIELVSIKPLMQTTLIKLYTYLVFKAHGNPEFEKYIVDRIEQQTGKINPKYDRGSFSKNIERQKKLGIVRSKQLTLGI